MKYLISQRYRHPELGVIHVVVRSNARRFIARWKNSELEVTVPQMTTKEAYDKAIEGMMPRLKARKPEQKLFGVGWTFDTDMYSFEVVAGKENMYRREVDHEKGIVTFMMAAATPPEGSPDFNQFVNEGLEEYARAFAGSVLIPEAENLARKLGLSPKSFSISRGTRLLGKCYVDGRIELSRNLIFYPKDCRWYVYAHELTHLTHMNHSPAFHALLNTYLDGREEELKRATDTFVIPIIK